MFATVSYSWEEWTCPRSKPKPAEKCDFFLYCCISKLQGGGRINRDLKSALVERSSLSNLDSWCVCSVVHVLSVSVQATLTATASLFRAIVAVREVEECKAKAGENPRQWGPWGCCCCCSLWWGLLLLEINDTLGSMRRLTAKTNNQPNTQAGLGCIEEWLQNKTGSVLAAHVVTQHWCPVQMDLTGPGGTALCTLIQVTTQSPERPSYSICQHSHHG